MSGTKRRGDGARARLERRLTVVVAELRWLSASASRLAIEDLEKHLRSSLRRQRAVLPLLDRHAETLPSGVLVTFRACQRQVLARARLRLAAAAARPPAMPHLN